MVYDIVLRSSTPDGPDGVPISLEFPLNNLWGEVKCSRPRRGCCWEERKRTISSLVKDHWFTLQANQWFCSKSKQKKIELVTRPDRCHWLMDVASPLLLQNNLPPLQLDTSSQPPSRWPDLAWKTCHSEKTGLLYGRSLGHGYALFLVFFAEFSSAKLDKMYHKYQFQSVMFWWGATETTFLGPIISVSNCNCNNYYISCFSKHIGSHWVGIFCKDLIKQTKFLSRMNLKKIEK